MRKLIATILALTTLYGAVALGNYTATQGSGTTFGSVVVGAVHYAQQFICDLTTPAQCAAVDASGNLSVKSSTLGTAANQAAILTAVQAAIPDCGSTPCTNKAGLVGQTGIWTMQPGNTPNTIPWLVTTTPTSGQGCTPGKTLSGASTNSTSVTAAATTLCKLLAINTTATTYYLKTYNKATAPTCNSDTVLATYPVPPTVGGVAVSIGAFGEAYSLGFGFCLTGAIADNDNTNAATGVAINYATK